MCFWRGCFGTSRNVSSLLLELINFPSFVCEADDIDVDAEHNYINCLLFAGDIVLIGNSEKKLQSFFSEAMIRVSYTTLESVILFTIDQIRFLSLNTDSL